MTLFRFLLVLSLLLVARSAHALGHEEPLQPGDLDAPEPVPELYRAGISVELIFPLGSANRQTDQSLGWRLGGVRWLRSGFGFSASLAHAVLAKDAVLPRDVYLQMWWARAGLRAEWQVSSGRALFIDAHAIFAAKTSNNRGDEQTETGRGAGLAAGAVLRVAPCLYARLQASYSDALHRVAAIDFGFVLGF